MPEEPTIHESGPIRKKEDFSAKEIEGLLKKFTRATQFISNDRNLRLAKATLVEKLDTPAEDLNNIRDQVRKSQSLMSKMIHWAQNEPDFKFESPEEEEAVFKLWDQYKKNEGLAKMTDIILESKDQAGSLPKKKEKTKKKKRNQTEIKTLQELSIKEFRMKHIVDLNIKLTDLLRTEGMEFEDRKFISDANEKIVIFGRHMENPREVALSKEDREFWRKEVLTKDSRLNKLLGIEINSGSQNVPPSLSQQPSGSPETADLSPSKENLENFTKETLDSEQIEIFWKNVNKILINPDKNFKPVEKARIFELRELLVNCRRVINNPQTYPKLDDIDSKNWRDFLEEKEDSVGKEMRDVYNKKWETVKNIPDKLPSKEQNNNGQNGNGENRRISLLNEGWEKLWEDTKKSLVYNACDEVLRFFEYIDDEKYKLKDDEIRLLRRTFDILDSISKKVVLSPEDGEFWDKVVSGKNDVRKILTEKLTQKTEINEAGGPEMFISQKTEEPDPKEKNGRNMKVSMLNERWDKLPQSTQKSVVYNASRNILRFYENINDEKYQLKEEDKILLRKTIDILEAIGDKRDLSTLDTTFWEKIVSGENNVRQLLTDKLIQQEEINAAGGPEMFIKKEIEPAQGVENAKNEISGKEEQINPEKKKALVKNLFYLYRKDKLLQAKYTLSGVLINEKKVDPRLRNIKLALDRLFNAASSEDYTIFSVNDFRLIDRFMKEETKDTSPSSSEQIFNDDKVKAERFLSRAKKPETRKFLEKCIETLNEFTKPGLPVNTGENNFLTFYFSKIKNGAMEAEFNRLEGIENVPDNEITDQFIERVGLDNINRICKEAYEAHTLKKYRDEEWKHYNTPSEEAEKILTFHFLAEKAKNNALKEDRTPALTPEEIKRLNDYMNFTGEDYKILLDMDVASDKPFSENQKKTVYDHPTLSEFEQGIASNADSIKPEEQVLINEKLAKLGIDINEFKRIEGFKDIENDAGRQMFVLNNLRQIRFKNIKEEAKKRHAEQRNELGFFSRIRKGKHIGDFHQEITKEGFALKGIDEEVSRLIAISKKGPSIKIEVKKGKKGEESGFELVGQYANADLAKNYNIEDGKIEDFNRAAQNFALHPKKSELENMTFRQRRAYEKIKAEYEKQKNELINAICLKEGLDPVKEGENLANVNTIDFNVKSHQTLINHPDVEKELRRFEENKALLGVTVLGLATGVATRLGVAAARRYVQIQAVSHAATVWALPISMTISALAGGGIGYARGRSMGRKELAQRHKDIIENRINQTHSAARHFGKREATIDRNYTTATSLTSKLIRLQERLHEAINKDDGSPESKNKIKDLHDALNARIYFTRKKLDDESIIFGPTKEALGNKLLLIQTMSDAQTEAHIGEEAKKGFKKKTRLELLNNILQKDAKEIEGQRNKFINRKGLKSAAYGATFAVAGSSAAHYIGGTEFGHEMGKKIGEIGHSMSDFVKHMGDFTKGHGDKAALAISNQAAEEIQNNISYQTTQTTLANALREWGHEDFQNLPPSPYSTTDSFHHELTSAAATVTENRPEVQTVGKLYDLDKESDSRERILIRYFKEKFIKQENLNDSDAYKKAAKSAYNIINNKNLSVDLGGDRGAAHHTALDREKWFKPMHKGDSVMFTEHADGKIEVKVIPKAEVSNFKASHNLDTHTTFKNGVDVKEAVTTTTGSGKTPVPTVNTEVAPPTNEEISEVLKNAHTQIEETIKENLAKYGYRGDPTNQLAINRFAEVTGNNIFKSHPTLENDLINAMQHAQTIDTISEVEPNGEVGVNLIVDGTKLPLEPIMGPGGHLKTFFTPNPENQTPWKEAWEGKQTVWEKGGTMSGIDKRVNYVGEMVNDNSSTSVSHNIPDNIAHTIDTRSAKDLISSNVFDRETVKSLVDVHVSDKTTWVEQLRDSIYKDSHFSKLSPDQRSTVFYRLFKNMLNSNDKKAYETMGLGDNPFDTTPGSELDLTKGIGKDDLKGIFNNLDNIPRDEISRADYLNKHLKEVVNQLKNIPTQLQNKINAEGFDGTLEAMQRTADGTPTPIQVQ